MLDSSGIWAAAGIGALASLLLNNLPAAVLADAEATHPLLIDSDGQRTSTAYDPEAIIAGYNQPLPEPADATELTVDDWEAVANWDFFRWRFPPPSTSFSRRTGDRRLYLIPAL